MIFVTGSEFPIKAQVLLGIIINHFSFVTVTARPFFLFSFCPRGICIQIIEMYSEEKENH